MGNMETLAGIKVFADPARGVSCRARRLALRAMDAIQHDLSRLHGSLPRQHEESQAVWRHHHDRKRHHACQGLAESRYRGMQGVWGSAAQLPRDAATAADLASGA